MSGVDTEHGPTTLSEFDFFNTFSHEPKFGPPSNDIAIRHTCDDRGCRRTHQRLSHLLGYNMGSERFHGWRHPAVDNNLS